MAYDGLTHDPLRDQVRTTRALRYSVWDGVFHAIMLGVGESYLGAFAVELGHRDTALAVLMTVPLLIGALSQLLSAPLCRALGSRKQLVVLGAAVQAVSHVGFILIAHFGITNFWTLLAVQSLFYVSGTLIAPAWGAWMANLTQGLDRSGTSLSVRARSRWPAPLLRRRRPALATGHTHWRASRPPHVCAGCTQPPFSPAA